MLDQFNKTIVNKSNKELVCIRKDVQEMVDSMSFINDKFEAFEKTEKSTTNFVKKLEAENVELRTTVGDLLGRFTHLEQQSRSNNLEIQCMPERRNENFYNIINHLGQVVNCEIKEKVICMCAYLLHLPTF